MKKSKGLKSVLTDTQQAIARERERNDKQKTPRRETMHVNLILKERMEKEWQWKVKSNINIQEKMKMTEQMRERELTNDLDKNAGWQEAVLRFVRNLKRFLLGRVSFYGQNLHLQRNMNYSNTHRGKKPS